ncbi:response regulator [Desulfocurvus sp. DL9XJH121]
MTETIIRVLVVDDDETFRTNLTTLLNRDDTLFAHGVDSGEAALEELGHTGYDVMLLDVRMPGLNALGTLKEMRKRNLDKVVVIILTGHASVDDAVEMMNHGAFDYLLKPCSTKEIVKKIHWANERGALSA